MELLTSLPALTLRPLRPADTSELARLANVEREALPTPEQAQEIRQEPMAAYLLNKHRADPKEQQHQIELLAQQWLEEGRVQEAWRLLLLQ